MNLLIAYEENAENPNERIARYYHLVTDATNELNIGKIDGWMTP